MNKEPIGLYLFRFVVGLAVVIFLGMLYWSSNLLEENLRGLRTELRDLKNEALTTRQEIQKIREDVLQTILDDQKNRQELLKAIVQNHHEIQTLKQAIQSGATPQPSKQTPNQQEAATPQDSTTSELKIALTENNPLFRNRPQIDPSLENLLKEDPFYAKTLKTLLPLNFKPWGTRRDATVLSNPPSLHPFIGLSPISDWVSQCSGAVATMEFGKYESLSPSMAIKMEERKIPNSLRTEFWIHLRRDLHWLPLKAEQFPPNVEIAAHFLRSHPVTAHDFKFYFDAIMNPHLGMGAQGAIALRNYLGNDKGGIEEIRVIDDLTFVVRWKAEDVVDATGKAVPRIKYIAKGWTGALRPLARFIYQHFPDGQKIIEDDTDPETYRNNSVWAQNFTEHWAKNIIVSCGAWIYDGITDEQIRFKRNPDFFDREAVLINDMSIAFRDNPDSIWQDFKAGKIDVYSLNATKLAEYEKFITSEEYAKQERQGLGIKRIDYVDHAYNYVGWNETSDLFKSKKVRQAMTMAIDRDRIIKQNLNQMGVPITGPAFVNSTSYDSSIKPLPFDPQAAKDQLAKEGWYDSDGDGILDKEINGKRVPFSFKLYYYVKNPITKTNCETIQSSLKEIGIDCKLQGSDITELTHVFSEKNFDAVYFGWALGTPPEEHRQLWHSSGAKEKNSSNAVGFANADADAMIDLLEYEYDPKKRVELYHKFHQIIHDEQPYTFLYSPKAILLYRDYVENVFIPIDKQKLIPGATVSEPDLRVMWLKDLAAEKKNEEKTEKVN